VADFARRYLDLERVDRAVREVTRSRSTRSTPIPSSAAVSAQMQRMGRRNTAPEIALRRALTALGLRYRLHRRDLPGTPDIAFVGARVAVFVDGCFWHGCPDHGVMPKANRDWWRTKLEANRTRDERKDRALVEAGWLPMHVWEHEDPAAAAVAIADVVTARLKLAGGKTGPLSAARRTDR
jgi:DNA mismatch endonuclease (patch repair protein)